MKKGIYFKAAQKVFKHNDFLCFMLDPAFSWRGRIHTVGGSTYEHAQKFKKLFVNEFDPTGGWNFEAALPESETDKEKLAHDMRVMAMLLMDEMERTGDL